MVNTSRPRHAVIPLPHRIREVTVTFRGIPLTEHTEELFFYARRLSQSMAPGLAMAGRLEVEPVPGDPTGVRVELTGLTRKGPLRTRASGHAFLAVRDAFSDFARRAAQPRAE